MTIALLLFIIVFNSIGLTYTYMANRNLTKALRLTSEAIALHTEQIALHTKQLEWLEMLNGG